MTLLTLKNLAKCYENSEEYKKAIEVAKSALEKYQKVFHSKPYETKALLQILISSLEADGNHKEALSYKNMMRKI